MLPPVLADCLRANRSGFNDRFAAARRRWPQLDPTDFGLFLRDQLAPLVVATDPAAANRVAQAGYDLGLQLVAEKFAGPAASDPTLNLLWVNTFPCLAPLIAVAPRRVLGSFCNAAHRLATTAGCDPEEWRRQLAVLGPSCIDIDQLLAIGRLLAWRAGLAAYRVAALAEAANLPAALALRAVRAPASATWTAIAASHARDPWFGYAPDGTPLPRQALVRRVGTFRGFGGLFRQPPVVASHDGLILVRCGEEAWALQADAYGATFHRAPVPRGPASAAGSTAAPTRFARHLPAGHTAASVAVTDSTFALTSAQSHAVWVGPSSVS